MPDISSRTDSYSNSDDSCEEECIEPRMPRNHLVQTVDIIEIVRFLRKISDYIENCTINHSTGEAGVQESDYWVDNDYLYVEIPYLQTDALMMDICVQGGRAFFRVAREGLGAEVVEMPAQTIPPQFLIGISAAMRQG